MLSDGICKNFKGVYALGLMLGYLDLCITSKFDCSCVMKQGMCMYRELFRPGRGITEASQGELFSLGLYSSCIRKLCYIWITPGQHDQPHVSFQIRHTYKAI